MSNVKTVFITEVAVRMDKTPLLGGAGREALVNVGANVGVASGVLLEGNNTNVGDGDAAPTTGWTTLLSAPQVSPVVQIDDLPAWVRSGAALTSQVTIEGVQ